MEAENSTLFLVEGNKEMEWLVDTGRASVVCTDRGYTLKNILCSSTFLIRRGTRYLQAKGIFELAENRLDLEAIASILPPSPLSDLSGAVDLKLGCALGDEQLDAAESALRLLRTERGHMRIRHADVLKVLRLLRSDREALGAYPGCVVDWALRNFRGTNEELGFYCFMDCYEGGKAEHFVDIYRTYLLDEPDPGSLLEYFSSSFIPRAIRADVLEKLKEKMA
jgi:hypothetical protein